MSFGKNLVQSAKEALEIAKGNAAAAPISKHGQVAVSVAGMPADLGAMLDKGIERHLASDTRKSVHVDNITEAEADALAAELEACIKDD